MAGKPSVMTPEMIDKFKQAFSMWFSDKEAMLFCWVKESTFYEFCSKNKDFAELKEILKDKPKMNAKAVIAHKIESGDDYNARWHLERKVKDEFSIRTENENKNTNLNLDKDINDMDDKDLLDIINW